jgi:hypothetical protein
MAALINSVIFFVMLCSVSLAGASAVHVVRDAEQTDPITGLHWQRMGDPQRPSAPPRLKLIRSDQPAKEHGHLPAIACVRAGDHVLLRGTNFGLSTMRLEATVLESGVCGARVRARVAVTGALVEMTVLESGAGILSGKADPWR